MPISHSASSRRASSSEHWRARPARLTFQGAGKSYPGRNGQQETVALADLDLSIAPSEIVSILGPTGCGKSSALNLIAGFELPTTGSVSMDGKPVAGPGPERAVVFQQAALFPWLDVFGNVTLGLKCRGMSAEQYTPLARQLIAEVGLAGFERHYPYQLSGGMQQRVQIARALAAHPGTLLMDEPFGALDFQTRLQMHELLLKLWQAHRPTIFFITHDVAEAIFLSDRVVVMSQRPGRVVREVRIDSPKPRSTDFLGSPIFTALQRELLHAVQHEARLDMPFSHS